MVVAQDDGAAREIAEAWRAAVPGVAADPRAVAAAPPAAPTPPPGAGIDTTTTHGEAPPRTSATPVVVSGNRLSVGAPPPEPPGPPAPRSALPGPDAHALSEAAAGSDLVVAWVEVLDAGSLRAGPVAEAAAAASAHAVPVVALAGRVEVSRRELATAGVSGAHAVPDTDMGVRRVARSWTPRWA